LPTEIPENIEVDVSHLNIGDSIQVSDLNIPEGIEVIDNPETAVAGVRPPTIIEEPVVGEEEEMIMEPEVIGEAEDEEEPEEEG
jgi:large subunit ribosomal protein L25